MVGFAFPNEPDGFRDLKWGDTPTEDMVYYREFGDNSLYRRPSDPNIGIANVSFYDILYLFNEKEQFKDISAFIKSLDDYNILEIHCRDKYGKPTEEYHGKLLDGKYGETPEESRKRVYHKLEWHGESTRVTLYYNPIEKTGYISLTSQLILEEIEENEHSTQEDGLIISPGHIVLSGHGQQASELFTLENGLSIFRMYHEGQSHFAIWLLDSKGKKVELLVNKLGNFDGSKAVHIEKAGTYLLDISADGNWLVDIATSEAIN